MTYNPVLEGRILPNADKLEAPVLGAILIEKDALLSVIDILTPESFYNKKHACIFEACLDLFAKQHPIDLLTVTQHLMECGKLETAGGAHYIVELTNMVASAANVEYHARIIQEAYMKRQVISVSTGLLKKGYDPTQDVFELLDNAEQELFEVSSNKNKRAFKKVNSIMAAALKQIQSLQNNTDGIIGITSGFGAVDKISAGWQDTDLTIIAARPGMGKTAFALILALEAAKAGYTVGIFSLEMSELQLGQRLLSFQSDISLTKIRNGQLEGAEWEVLAQATEAISALPIHIDDTPGLNINELRAKARRLKTQEGVDFIIVDYLQLMSGVGKANSNREQEVSNISRGLKLVAKELNIPVHALSQLNRAVETRGGAKRPQLSDLRESGSIEQDADRVLFLYRPDYYDIIEDENGNCMRGLCEVIFAKNRNGALDTAKLRFVADRVGFTDWSEDWNQADDSLPATMPPIKAGGINIDDDLPF